MPHLSKPQALVLGMWSFAIAMTHHCGLSTVTVFLAEMLEQPENTVSRPKSSAIAHRKIPIKLIVVKKTVLLDTFFGTPLERV
jgi:hypothetical protein